MKNRECIAGFLAEHAGSEPVSFHMPGHKGQHLYRENGYGDFLDRIMDCDITEIAGADNLFQTEGIIKATMERYRKLYDVKESYLLINGSSAGIIAAIMSTVPKGGRVIMARNCHKSVFNALLLAEAEPVYAYPEMVNTYEISGEVTPHEIERCILENPESSAVILPSPNYYGICSDIQAIAEVVHRHGKLLIVDQAHGAHLCFFDRYTDDPKKAAEGLGADIVINSTHKTLASFTQSAVVNLCSERVDKYEFEDKLQMIESTSPSYVLMSSLDINADLLETKGRQLIKEWKQNIEYFYEEARKIPGLALMKHELLDSTKINLDMSAHGIDGLELEKRLLDRNIFVELVTGNIVMCMTGIGNRRCDFDTLLKALKKIAAENPLCSEKKQGVQHVTMKKLKQHALPTKKERIPLEKSSGRICAASIIPYPPGIPVICPGEEIDDEVLQYVRSLRLHKQKVIGIDDLGRVTVGKL